MPDAKPKDASSGVFPHTRWSLIARIRGEQSTIMAGALEEICGAYWYPLYLYARRFGLDEPGAKDAVQDLFARLLEGNRIASADAARGRLRTFLLTALKNVIGQNREKEQAAKRGGGIGNVSLDLTDAEGRFLHDPESREASPERTFERKWALEVLESAKRRLGETYAGRGKSAVFEALAPALFEGGRWNGHEEAARLLGMNEGAAKVALHRLRKQYREVLLEEVGLTLDEGASEAELNDELAYLRRLFAG